MYIISICENVNHKGGGGFTCFVLNHTYYYFIIHSYKSLLFIH